MKFKINDLVTISRNQVTGSDFYSHDVWKLKGENDLHYLVHNPANGEEYIILKCEYLIDKANFTYLDKQDLSQNATEDTSNNIEDNKSDNKSNNKSNNEIYSNPSDGMYDLDKLHELINKADSLNKDEITGDSDGDKLPFEGMDDQYTIYIDIDDIMDQLSQSEINEFHSDEPMSPELVEKILGLLFGEE